MKRVEQSLPLPFYVIDKNYNIVGYSNEAEEELGLANNFLQLLDEESHEKFQKMVRPENIKVTVEINFKKSGGEFQLADLHVLWDSDLHAKVLVHLKGNQLQKVTESLAKLRSRLNESNLQLLEEKEKLEEAVKQNNLLSAPFIELNEETALIPLFGNLTEEKLFAVEDHIVRSAQKEGIDRVFFDFTGVGELKREGITVLNNVISSLFLMGVKVKIIGVKPQQARELKEMPLPSELNFMSTLQEAIQKYCTK
ncbi:STAS domain-containing protein [Halobacillus yeomjeoni]|uniref:STAS domain-containing protein n=1 Tax=Halobacillus yeomjeoni TaxID=311194 RepID=A0A931MW15_9BACI|nr:STAS domain-containing protein [Halobacillus yeomjeoni]MBH0230999.1 STAS domain-containing protein [Halobacillus yeomjeoni]